MMKLVIKYYDESLAALSAGADINDIVALPVREAIGRFKYVEEKDVDAQFTVVSDKLASELRLAAAKKEEF